MKWVTPWLVGLALSASAKTDVSLENRSATLSHSTPTIESSTVIGADGINAILIGDEWSAQAGYANNWYFDAKGPKFRIKLRENETDIRYKLTDNLELVGGDAWGLSANHRKTRFEALYDDAWFARLSQNIFGINVSADTNRNVRAEKNGWGYNLANGNAYVTKSLNALGGKHALVYGEQPAVKSNFAFNNWDVGVSLGEKPKVNVGYQDKHWRIAGEYSNRPSASVAYRNKNFSAQLTANTKGAYLSGNYRF